MNSPHIYPIKLILMRFENLKNYAISAIVAAALKMKEDIAGPEFKCGHWIILLISANLTFIVLENAYQVL